MSHTVLLPSLLGLDTLLSVFKWKIVNNRWRLYFYIVILKQVELFELPQSQGSQADTRQCPGVSG